jgi:hypothetical protein
LSHLCLCLHSGLFPSGFPSKTLCAFLLYRIRATGRAHLILLDLIIPILSVLSSEMRCHMQCHILALFTVTTVRTSNLTYFKCFFSPRKCQE